MNTKKLMAACLVMASPLATAGTWTLADSDTSFAGNDVSIRLTGGSSDSCIPTDFEIARTGTDLLITLEPTPAGQLCFSAFRGWTLTVGAYDLPDDDYHVVVAQGETEIGEFDFTLTATGEGISDNGFTPTEGMWWNDEQPGSGLAFNVDDQGRWFAALYIYDESGQPTFLTMQGEELTYDLDPQPSEPYAIGMSPLIRSEDGQCLGCLWTPTTVAPTGENATLSFLNRNRAVLSIGDWSLELSPLPETFESADKVPMPILDRHYLMIVDGEQGRHVLTVEGGEAAPGGFTGQTGATLRCIDCETVNANGNWVRSISDQMRDFVHAMSFACNQSTCMVKLGNSVVRTFVDSSGETITAMLPNYTTPSSEPTRIELRLLPNGWRP